MENSEIGETSKKKIQEHGDSDRPLKKARYLWQVKGNYHLKENQPQAVCSEDSGSTDECGHNGEVCASAAKTNNVNMFSDRSCIEQIIASSDKIMEFPAADSPRKDIDKSLSDEIPITLVKPNHKVDDFYLRRWQARQIAKGFVDNTINRVLENWIVAPFDAADLVESCEDGGQVEDEGILMAIQSHGLQSVGPPEQPAGPCTCSRSRRELPAAAIPLFHHRSESDLTLEYYENLCTLMGPESEARTAEAVPGECDEAAEPVRADDSDFLDAAVAVAILKKGLTCG